MDDMISRKEAISELMEWVEKEKNKSWSPFKGLFHWTGIKAMLECLPSAQPEIIRCRDCKYWREHKYAKETKRYIPFCGFNAIYTESDDFCSRAERRTDD